MNYLGYWKIQRGPFENTRDPRFFYRGKDHAEGLERMLYLVRDGNMGFGVVTGEIGAGKTLTRTVLAAELPAARFATVVLENANLPFPFLLMEIITGIRNDRADGRSPELYYLLAEFRELLEERIIKRSRSLVLIIDEAQQLSDETLVELKNLTNISGPDRNYTSVILFGQPELRSRVRSLPQIDTRVSLRYHLGYLSSEEIAPYLAHRMRVAGHPSGTVFAAEAVDMIHRETGGIPREVNRIAKLALDRAFALERPQVTGPVVGSIIHDVYKQDGYV